MAGHPEVAVVTGAGRGLGAGLVAGFAAAGLRVAGCSRTKPAAAGAACYSAAVDVTDARSVASFRDEAVAALGPIDLWVNNAGVLSIAPLRDTDPEDVRRDLAVNIDGVINGTRAFVRHLHATGRPGTLVNISSGAGRRPYAGWATYCAAKAAVNQLTECVQLEEVGTGLRAIALEPGVVETEMQALIRAADETTFPHVQRFRELHRTGRTNSSTFVVAWILRLAAEDPQDAAGPRPVVVRVPDEWEQAE